jgi:hypothetical protein
MSPRPGEAVTRAWSRTAYAYGAVFALGLAYFLVRMPYQISDDLEHILIAQASSARDLLVTRYTTSESMRPLMWLTQNAVFELAPGGHYFATFKVVHVAELLVVVLLFVRLLRVRSGIDLIALPLALAALVGMHTFNVTMREAYPVNHFMSVLVCCLIVVSLAESDPIWWRDVAAVVTCTYALLTIETGVITWVCLVTCYAAGWRGVSAKAIALVTLVLAAYLVVRFTVLDVGTRTVGATSSGYGFSVRNTGDLVTLFGDAPWKFYAYNIACAALTVLSSEPRAGVFQFTRFVMDGDVPAWSIVNVTVSTIGTILIAMAIGRRIGRWRQWSFERNDVLLLVFVTVLAANSAMSYPYLKEVVMSPAGMFYAAALFIAIRDLLQRVRYPSARAAWLAIPLLVLSTGWTLRAVTLVESLRASAFVNRNDWALAEEREDEVRPQWRSRHRDAERLVRQLRQEVVNMPVPQPYTMPRWTGTWIDPY